MSLAVLTLAGIVGTVKSIGPGRIWLDDCPFEASVAFDVRDESFVMRVEKPVQNEEAYTHMAVQFNSDDFDGQYSLVFEDGSGSGGFPTDETVVTERIIVGDGDCGSEFSSDSYPVEMVDDNRRSVKVERDYMTGGRGFSFDASDLYLSYTCCIGYADCGGLEDPTVTDSKCGSGRVELGEAPPKQTVVRDAQSTRTRGRD